MLAVLCNLIQDARRWSRLARRVVFAHFRRRREVRALKVNRLAGPEWRQYLASAYLHAWRGAFKLGGGPGANECERHFWSIGEQQSKKLAARAAAACVRAPDLA